jgi:hypothetical protein
VSIKNVQDRLDLIHKLTIGDGSKTGDRKVMRELRKLLNSAETQIVVDVKVFASQLNTAYQRRRGKAPSKNISDKYKELTTELIKKWKTEVRTNKDDYMMVEKGQERLVFIVHEGKNRRGTPRDNYTLFRKKNQEFTLALIKLPKYNQLFHGRSKTASGRKRQIFDVGHVYSVTEKGRAGLAAGLAEEQLTGEEGQELTAADFQSEDQYKQLKSFKSKLGLASEEVLKVTTKGGLKLNNRIFLQLESDTGNRKKSASDRQAGRDVKETIQDILSKRFTGSNSQAIEIANQKGSDSPMDMIGAMIVNTPAKRKMYGKGKAKNNTKYKKAPKSVNKTSKASRTTEVPTERAIVYAAGITPDIAKQLPKGPGRPSTEKGKGDTDFAIAAAGLLAVKRAINKRLPEEVRRNMGRPALRFQTGRFARSTVIESITPAARTLLVKYTYRLNPYETFENEGRKKWPSGYNPKPLISKSIRNLALSMFKIDALTTRRV